MNSMTKPKIDPATSRRLIDLLPHRYPFLLVDRVEEYEPGERIVGIKAVTHNEPFFEGHFPNHPVMPGVLIIEAMIQTGGLIALDTLSEGTETIPFFTRIDKVRFRRPVVPGDVLLMKVEVMRNRRRIWWFQGEAYVNDDLAAEGEFQAAMENHKD